MNAVSCTLLAVTSAKREAEVKELQNEPVALAKEEADMDQIRFYENSWVP